MEAKPTLYKKKNIVYQKWMSDKDKGRIDTISALDYVVSYLLDRIPRTRNTNPKITPSEYGDMILLFKSGTGSGKSTSLAPAIFEKQECSIIVTEPKILITVEIVHDILRYHENLILGDNIGYQTGAMKKKPAKRKGITFVTAGILLQQFISRGVEWVAAVYTFIIIDEVHEKNLEIELLLYYVKSMLTSHWKKVCPFVILMSATFNEDMYRKYFDIPIKNYIEVEGYSYPIKEIWQSYDVQDYVARTLDIIRDIHMTRKDHLQRDIIIFVKGAADITNFLTEVSKLNEDKEMTDKAGYIYPLGLNRDIFIESGRRYQDIMIDAEELKIENPNARSKRITQKDEKKHMHSKDDKHTKDDKHPKNDKQKRHVRPTRRVIIATNVAETGVTIETLKYCIDTGYYINVWSDPVFGTEVISTTPITQFMSLQRKGRVGRKSEGEWYPLYTRDTFDKLQIDQPSKLITADIAYPLLNLIITDSTSVFAEEPYPEQRNSRELFNIYLDDSKRHNSSISSFGTSSSEKIYNEETVKKQMGAFSVQSKSSWTPYNLDLIELPSSDSLYNTLDRLLILGFINDECQPTALGCMANRIRKVKLESIRMIFAGYSYGANILDLITIAAFLEIGWRTVSVDSRYKYTPRSPLKNIPQPLASKVLWGCEFIEYLWIWYDFTDEMNRLIPKRNFMKSIKLWCEENKLNFQGLLDVSMRRDEIIANFISNDINPFYNGLELTRGTYNLRDILVRDHKLGMEEIQKIKHAIIDGYRYFLLSWNSYDQQYYSIYKHIPVTIESNLIRSVSISDERVIPKIIIVSGILLRQRFQSDMYEYTVSDAISIVDGFSIIDEMLLSTSS